VTEDKDIPPIPMDAQQAKAMSVLFAIRDTRAKVQQKMHMHREQQQDTEGEEYLETGLAYIEELQHQVLILQSWCRTRNNTSGPFAQFHKNPWKYSLFLLLIAVAAALFVGITGLVAGNNAAIQALLKFAVGG